MKSYMLGDLVDMEPRHRYFVLTEYWTKYTTIGDLEFYVRGSGKTLTFTSDLQKATVMDAEEIGKGTLSDIKGAILFYVPVTISKEGLVEIIE